MKHCPKCNLEFPDSLRFCGSCGGSLSDSLRCASCGELTEGKWTFCTSCGKPLSPDSANDQAPTPKTPEPVDLPEPPSSSPIPSIPAPPTLTIPSAEQSAARDRQRPERVAPQEWYSAVDLYDDSTTATPAPIPRQEKLVETMVPTPQAIARAHARDDRTAPALTMLSAYG